MSAASKTFEEPGAGAPAWIFSCNLLFPTLLTRGVVKLSGPGSFDYTSKLIIYSVVSFAGELKKVFSAALTYPSPALYWLFA